MSEELKFILNKLIEDLQICCPRPLPNDCLNFCSNNSRISKVIILGDTLFYE